MLNTGEQRSPVFVCLGHTPSCSARLDWLVVGLLNSERSQQDCADKCKGDAYREDIQPQGKVHVTGLLAVDRDQSLTEAGPVLKRQACCSAQRLRVICPKSSTRCQGAERLRECGDVRRAPCVSRARRPGDAALPKVTMTAGHTAAPAPAGGAQIEISRTAMASARKRAASSAARSRPNRPTI